MSVPDNILVVRLSSLGDVLLTMPAVQAIKTANPSASVAWLVEGPVAQLLACQSFVDRVIPFPRRSLHDSFARGRFAETAAKMRDFLKELRARRYDAILDFHGIAKSAFLVRAARGAKRFGFDRTVAKEVSWIAYDETVGTADRRIHKVMRNMLLARSVGAGNQVPSVRPVVKDEDHAYIDDFLSPTASTRRLIAVNPFCSPGSMFKRWDLEKYGALIKRVRSALDAEVMIVWGPGEEEEALRLRSLAGSDALLACPTTVTQLFALLTRVSLYIGGDTGVMHLAALASVPIVAIFGPTDVKVNGPFSDASRIVRRELACSPCRNKECAERRCLSEIGVEEVFVQVKALWGNI